MIHSADYCTAEHRRGVAGGGWEDEEDDVCDAAIKMQSMNHSIGSSSAGIENDRLTNSEILVFICEFTMMHLQETGRQHL